MGEEGEGKKERLRGERVKIDESGRKRRGETKIMEMRERDKDNGGEGGGSKERGLAEVERDHGERGNVVKVWGGGVFDKGDEGEEKNKMELERKRDRVTEK